MGIGMLGIHKKQHIICIIRNSVVLNCEGNQGGVCIPVVRCQFTDEMT